MMESKRQKYYLKEYIIEQQKQNKPDKNVRKKYKTR